jgi:hypothetical protein
MPELSADVSSLSITVGRYTITATKGKELLTIVNDAGEGGEFRCAELEAVIGIFFNEKF